MDLGLDLFGGDDALHGAVGGTQTNLVVIDRLRRSRQGVLCADSAHINVHESGAIEGCGVMR